MGTAYQAIQMMQNNQLLTDSVLRLICQLLYLRKMKHGGCTKAHYHVTRSQYSASGLYASNEKTTPTYCVLLSIVNFALMRHH